MRRAGYLRYTNKTAHSIVEDRYADKDWKTGERLSSNTSDSSGIVSPAEEVSSPYRYVSTESMSPVLLSLSYSSIFHLGTNHTDNIHSTPSKSLPLPPTTPTQSPDLRHLEKTHLRVNGDDGLGQKVIEPYHAPLLPMSAERSKKKPAVQLRVVSHKPTYLASAPNASAHKKPRTAESGAWQTVLSAKKPAAPSVKPAWGTTASGRPVVAPPRPTNPWGDEACEIPDLRSFRDAAVQPADAASVTTAEGLDCFVDSAEAACEKQEIGHAAVNQKKAKKYEREARRKAKKAGVQEEVVATIGVAAENVPLEDSTASTISQASAADVTFMKEVADLVSSTTIPVEPEIEIATTAITVETKSEPVVAVTEPSSLAPLPITQKDKHMNWTKFKRQFVVDQLTDPCLQAYSGCSHGTSCAYEASGALDCPFHEPRT